MSLPPTAQSPAAILFSTLKTGSTTNNTDSTRFGKFLSVTRTFFSNLWNHRLSVGLGLANIAGGLLIICLIDLPTFFGSEALTQGLPFFMLGAGVMQIVSAFIKAAADTRKSAPQNTRPGTVRDRLPIRPILTVRPGEPDCEICEDDDSPITGRAYSGLPVSARHPTAGPI